MKEAGVVSWGLLCSPMTQLTSDTSYSSRRLPCNLQATLGARELFSGAKEAMRMT